MNSISGSGDPDVDVAKVQDAVDQAGFTMEEVVLEGHFNFGNKQVTVTNAVLISATDATISGGAPPFLIVAKKNHAEIRGLVFFRPSMAAILVREVTNLVIAACKIRGVVTVPGAGFQTGGGIILVSKDPGTKKVTEIAGDILLTNNVLEIGAEDISARTFGFSVNLAEQTSQPNVVISENFVSDVTAHGLILRDIVGRAFLRENRIVTGSIGARLTMGDSFVDGIMCQGLGGYTIQKNTIDSGYENSAGIRLQGASLLQPINGATVEGNDITMSAERQYEFPTTESAGIELRRNCINSIVQDNMIFGRASAALSLVAERVPATGPMLTPNNSSLGGNDHRGFESKVADIWVGAGVTNTDIQGGPGGTIVSAGSIGTHVSPPGNYH